MKVYFGNSLGCTLWAIALTIFFFFTAGLILKLLITTPLGLVVLALMAYGYYRNRQRIKEFSNAGGFYWTNRGDANVYEDQRQSRDGSSDILGQAGSRPDIRQQYEDPSAQNSGTGIDRRSYSDVEDAEYVEVKDPK